MLKCLSDMKFPHGTDDGWALETNKHTSTPSDLNTPVKLYLLSFIIYIRVHINTYRNIEQ